MRVAALSHPIAAFLGVSNRRANVADIRPNSSQRAGSPAGASSPPGSGASRWPERPISTRSRPGTASAAASASTRRACVAASERRAGARSAGGS
jgi:hypothetical protein